MSSVSYEKQTHFIYLPTRFISIFLPHRPAKKNYFPKGKFFKSNVPSPFSLTHNLLIFMTAFFQVDIQVHTQNERNQSWSQYLQASQ